MNFYGIEWDIANKPKKMLDEFGARYHVFDSREGRDAWVENKAEAEKWGDHREALSSKDARLRCYLRDKREGWESLCYHYKDEDPS